jgi:hypothetical protein
MTTKTPSISPVRESCEAHSEQLGTHSGKPAGLPDVDMCERSISRHPGQAGPPANQHRELSSAEALLYTAAGVAPATGDMEFIFDANCPPRHCPIPRLSPECGSESRDEDSPEPSPVSELLRVLTRLGAAYDIDVGARLPGGIRDPWLQLVAVCYEGDGAEYTRLLHLATLDRRAPRVIAAEFVQEARRALRGDDREREPAKIAK